VSDKVSTSVRIAFLSDVHNTLYGKDMSELIRSVDSFAPHAVLFGGDLYDYRNGEPNTLALVRALCPKYPCFYALGNHEFKYGYEDRIRGEMNGLGVNVLTLDRNVCEFTVNTTTINITGIDSPLFKEQLKRASDVISPDRFTLLLNHYPEDFPDLSGKGFDLILSGHAHGGQWRLPGILPNGVVSPGEGFFPKYTCGIYEENGSEMIVSRGLARSPRDIIIPRIFNRPEIVFITIKP
ncbi:MAG: metallophosphoesterase, partial [Ruminiclostridium sp.]|nr:metallophosphoesterase [Ruminiclostridium sp.]